VGTNSNIAWCDHTFNSWRGCSPIGSGCLNCFAREMAKRNPNVLGEWGPDKDRIIASDSYWRLPKKWDRATAKAGERRKAFVGSMMDIFDDHPSIPDDIRRTVFLAAEEFQNLDWLYLTKRPWNIEKLLPDSWLTGSCPRNVWFGVSASRQSELDRNWNILDSETHNMNPSVLFLSLEPILERLDLESPLTVIDCGDNEAEWWTRRPDWVLVGAESGPNRRICEVSWIQDVADQCLKAEVPVLVKQDSHYRPGQQGRIPDDLWSLKQFPEVKP